MSGLAPMVKTGAWRAVTHPFRRRESDSARLVLTIAGVVLISIVFTACRVSGGEGRMRAQANIDPILLFSGTGTSPQDVAALQTILKSGHFNYSTVNSAQFNGMNEPQIREYRLLIVPGGNFESIGNGLTSSTTANIHKAVQKGLNYLGICAGAFFAGDSPYNGLNLAAGARFGFYAAEARGIRKAPVAITAAGGQTLDQYWEDGPQLTGWGAVVGSMPTEPPQWRRGHSETDG